MLKPILELKRSLDGSHEITFNVKQLLITGIISRKDLVLEAGMALSQISRVCNG